MLNANDPSVQNDLGISLNNTAYCLQQMKFLLVRRTLNSERKNSLGPQNLINTATFYWGVCTKPRKWVVMYLCVTCILRYFYWIFELFQQCGIFQQFRQCGIFELFRKCGIFELFRQCGIFELFRQCGIFELFRQCGIFELFRQCGIFKLFRHCGIFLSHFIALIAYFRV